MKTISVTKLCGITTITDISTDTFYTDSCIKIYVNQDIKNCLIWKLSKMY